MPEVVTALFVSWLLPRETAAVFEHVLCAPYNNASVCTNSKQWFTTSLLQPLQYLVMPYAPSTGLRHPCFNLCRIQLRHMLQAPVYDILASTSAVFSYAICSKHWFTTSLLQPLPYLVTPSGPENCQLKSSFLLVLKQW